MSRHPLRHRLTNSIGSIEVIDQTRIDVVQKVLTEHEIFIMICSDGVWELIENEVFI
jgi:serine/threonine protein phosphatase PrpC